MKFEWHPGKADANQKKHGITFDEATSVFGDPLSVTIPDPRHSPSEDRFITLGHSANLRLVVVVHTDREESIRIISIRRANSRERRNYEEGL